MNVHSYCQKKVANLCGINQKVLAEALSQVSQVCTVKNVYIIYKSVLKDVGQMIDYDT